METPTKTPVILTIEDNDLVRRNFRSILTHYGYHVLEAENGAIGMAVFEREAPDLVLIDLKMPVMDGVEVLRLINASSRPNVPTIIVSGTKSVSDAVKALRLGAWDYIFKPIEDISILKHVIDRNLERADLIRKNNEYHQHLAKTLEQIQEDEDAGHKMQLKLLPPALTKIQGHTLQRCFIPSAYLSGDFLDYFPINNEYLAFYTADVSGHGIPSALITIYLKTFMHKYLEYSQQGISNIICDPAALLKRLNNQLLKEDLDKHLTLFYGLISIKTRVMTYANAGQFPPPLLWQNKTTELLEGNNTAIGLFPDAEYSVSTKQLEKNFFLAIFSDGILDALPQPNLDQKIGFLKTLASASAIQGYINSLDTDHLEDDLTVLTIERSVLHD